MNDFTFYWLKPWETVLEKLTVVAQLVKKFILYNENFINQPLVCALNQINPLHKSILYIFNVHFNVSIPSMNRSNKYSLSVSPSTNLLQEETCCFHIYGKSIRNLRQQVPPKLSHITNKLNSSIYQKTIISGLLFFQFYRESQLWITLHKCFMVSSNVNSTATEIVGVFK